MVGKKPRTKEFGLDRSVLSLCDGAVAVDVVDDLSPKVNGADEMNGIFGVARMQLRQRSFSGNVAWLVAVNDGGSDWITFGHVDLGFVST